MIELCDTVPPWLNIVSSFLFCLKNLFWFSTSFQYLLLAMVNARVKKTEFNRLAHGLCGLVSRIKRSYIAEKIEKRHIIYSFFGRNYAKTFSFLLGGEQASQPPSTLNGVGHSFPNCIDTWCQKCMVWSSGGYMFQKRHKMQ